MTNSTCFLKYARFFTAVAVLSSCVTIAGVAGAQAPTPGQKAEPPKAGPHKSQSQKPHSQKPGPRKAEAAKPEKPYHKRVLAELPKSPRERAEVLSNLYALLATAENQDTGTEIAGVIERLWLFGYGDTVAVLLQRASTALTQKKDALALRFLDAVVVLAPDYAEGWHQRAVVHYSRNEFSRALGDLRRVLALDPNHYKALEGLSRMLEETGQKAGALAAHRKLMLVHPYWPEADQRLRELERKSEGQGI